MRNVVAIALSLIAAAGLTSPPMAMAQAAPPEPSREMVPAPALPLQPSQGLPGDNPRIIRVGPGRDFLTIHEAAAAVIPGQTVEIFQGRYSECAIWPSGANNITITGIGRVVVSQTNCNDKALFVVRGDDVTVRNITFSRASVPDHNGAGIRAEGVNLTVEKSKFLNNENGILAGTVRDSTIIVRKSVFRGNGSCIAACAHGIYVDQIKRIRIEDCTFIGQQVGHHIKSRALRTEVVHNVIRDGKTGTASYLIDVPQGGSILITGNMLEKGPRASNRSVAISIGAESEKGLNPAGEFDIEDNCFANDMARQKIGRAHV